MKPFGIQIAAEFINCPETILNNKKALEDILRLGISKCNLNLKTMNIYKYSPVGVTAVAVIGESHIAVHTYPEARHATVDIFTCSAKSKAPTNLLRFLKLTLKPKTVKVVELIRGNAIEVKQNDWIQDLSTDEFEIRYHIKRNLMSKRSQFQQIDIIENKKFGRMLFLDKDLQTAEMDAHLYNEAIVAPLIKAKNGLNKVAILGGGDGGVAQELLKHKPQSVFVVDIDKEVVMASKKFLQSLCKGAFNDPRVKVVIDDANKFLEKNQGFDAIIWDFTMHPETLTRMNRPAFLDEIFLKIKNSLKEKGIVSMQCCSELDTETLKLLNKTLPKNFADINFKNVFLPSYSENWVFASAEAK